MSKRSIFGFKPALRLEWRDQDGKDKTQQRDHCALTLGDSPPPINTDKVFGTHNPSSFSHQIDQLKERVMAKGYWIVSVDVSNPESYKLYLAENRNAFRKYGARFLIRGGKREVVEGAGRARIVVIEFKDYATALECYHSPEYAKAIEIRKGSAVADIIIADGYHGPQPTDG